MELSKRKLAIFAKQIRRDKFVALIILGGGLLFTAVDIVVYGLLESAAPSGFVDQLLVTVPKLSFAIFGSVYLRKAIAKESKLARVQLALSRRRYATIGAQ